MYRLPRLVIRLAQLCGILWLLLSCAATQAAQSPAFDGLPAPKYAGIAAAEVLIKRTRIDLDDQGYATSYAYAAIYLHGDEAVRDYSQMSIGFNSFYETVQLEFARVKTPEGKIVTLAPDAVQVQSPADENFYQDGRELTFSLPNLRPGATIEFQYQRKEIKKVIPKQWFDSFWFNWWEERAANQGMRVDPVGEASLDIYAPDTINFQVKTSSALKVQHWKKTHPGQTQWHWQQTALPEIVLQSDMPRDINLFPMLQVSTIGQWNLVASWADGLISPHIVTDDTILSIARDLQKNAKNPADKVKNLFAYMQDKIRYVFAHVGRGGYEPHSTPEIIKNAYGDCKDQTVLAVALARAMGLTAYPALVATRGQGLTQLDTPAVNFDHMIVYFPAQSGLAPTWMDTTAQSSYFPGFSTGIEGQQALIVRPDTKGLVTIPARGAADHRVHVIFNFNAPSSNSVSADLTIQLSGVFEESLRSTWLYAPEKQKALSDMLGNLYSTGQLSNLQVRNAENPFAPLEISGEFLFKNVWQGTGKPMVYAFGISQLLGVFSDLIHMHKPPERKQPIENDPAYTLSAQLLFRAPEGKYQSFVQSRGGNFHNAWFSLHQVVSEKENVVQVNVDWVLAKRIISLAEYPKYYSAVQSVLEGAIWQVGFLPKESASLPAKSARGDNTPALAAIRQLLDSGDFSAALRAGQNAVKQFPNSGEAFYLLGLAQGYSDQAEAAQKSFKKARELGFAP